MLDYLKQIYQKSFVKQLKKIEGFVFEENLQKDPDQRNYIVSNKKIENLGFKPKVSLDEGIDELIKGYKMLKTKKYSNI